MSLELQFTHGINGINVQCTYKQKIQQLVKSAHDDNGRTQNYQSVKASRTSDIHTTTTSTVVSVSVFQN